MVFHQGDLPLRWFLIRGWFLIRMVFPQGGISSGWSLVREWSLLWVVSHQGDLPLKFLIQTVFPQGGISSGWSPIKGWSLIRMVSSGGWSPIRVVFPQRVVPQSHQMVSLTPGQSFIRVDASQGGLSLTLGLGWSLFGVVSHLAFYSTRTKNRTAGTSRCGSIHNRHSPFSAQISCGLQALSAVLFLPNEQTVLFSKDKQAQIKMDSDIHT